VKEKTKMPSRTVKLGMLLSCACTLALLATVVPSQGQDENQKGLKSERKNVMTMKDDLANRATAIHWPDGFDPATADLFSHNALHIGASCERVWHHIVEATKWPEWYPNSKDVQIVDGAPTLAAGSLFRWTTFGLPLESKINEFVPYTRIGWFGYAPGTSPTFYHTWYLQAEGGGCLVVTDEVGNGKDVFGRAQRSAAPSVTESLVSSGTTPWQTPLCSKKCVDRFHARQEGDRRWLRPLKAA
jgi:Polyketide cyclase / dehydrase and lipid transport